MHSTPKKNVIEFSEQNSFDEIVIIESKKFPIMVNFYSEWYTPCIKKKQKLEEFSSTNNIKLINIDVEQNQELSNRYNISEIPHVFLFHKGYSVLDYNGNDKDKIYPKMVEYIQQSTNKFYGHRQCITDKKIVPKNLNKVGYIPEEPPEGDNIFELGFKYNNDIFMRRFSEENNFGEIKEYVKNKIGVENINIFTPSPRKVYNENNLQLKNSGLCKREILNVELI